MRAPEFWKRHDYTAKLAVAVLSPIGRLYGASVAWKRDNTVAHRAKAKVVCIGNLTAGGSGKTPVCIAVARALQARNLRTIFLSRGYGGHVRGPVFVDPAVDRPGMIGDEPLLLAAAGRVIVSRNRALGADLADAEHTDIIVMDDGYQNFSLAKDLSIVVVDAETAFGNGRILPAGPLREPIAQGLARADAVVMVGNETPSLPGFAGPVLRARLTSVDVIGLTGMPIVAFAGIGRPEKFFETLRVLGAEIVEARAYGDHHVYTASEIARLQAKARGAEATLITTEKDFVRLTPAERQNVRFLPVRAAFEDAGALDRLLDRVATPR
jgi:tetraacyldisaccharide 4'-kinase